LEAGEEASYASEEECVQAFMAVFGEAVRCRMRSIGHVSAMMSGGLDSASIAAMVRRLLPEFPGKQLHTYSAISDQPETCAESQCILSLAEDMGNNAHFVSVPSFTGMLNVHDLVETAWPKAHPVDNSILLPAMMCLAASRDGHRVMLHGAGGDLATYVPANHPAYLLRAGQWLDAWRACKSASRNNTYLRGVSPGRLLLRNIWHAYSPPRIRYWAGRLRELKPESPLSANLINRDLAKRMRLLERRSTEYVPLQEPQNAHIRAMMGPYGFVMGLSGFEHVAGRYGVEMRDPWSDRRLAEFWLRLPLKYKLWDGWTKYLVRSGFAPDLAPLVRWRQGKEHVGWNFSSRLMDESRDFVAQVLENDLQTLAPYADVEAVRRMYAKYCAVNGYVKQSRIYDIITLIIWLKRVFR
jgi:asparagine synthase (glutamine-hydrolysing)